MLDGALANELSRYHNYVEVLAAIEVWWPSYFNEILPSWSPLPERRNRKLCTVAAARESYLRSTKKRFLRKAVAMSDFTSPVELLTTMVVWRVGSVSGSFFEWNPPILVTSIRAKNVDFTLLLSLERRVWWSTNNCILTFNCIISKKSSRLGRLYVSDGKVSSVLLPSLHGRVW